MSLVSAANRDAYIENKRDRILKVALEVFREKGYANTSIMDIAKRADMGKGTLYLYFKSKEELLHSVFMECSTIPALANWSFDLDAPIAQVLLDFAKAILKDVQSLVSLLLMSTPDLLKFAKEHPNDSFNNMYAQICRNLELYLETKKLENEISQECNSKILAQAFISMINFPILMQELGNGFSDPAQTEQYIEGAVALIVKRL